MSPIALAHATPAAPPYNSLFYATVALIIPVLFLAIAVQGSTYQDVWTACLAALQGTLDATTRLRRAITSTVVTVSLVVIIDGTLVFGAAGEIYAILALYRQQPNAGAPFFTLTGTIFLIVVATSAPVITLLRAHFVRGQGSGK